jgi:hypothetical protein
MRLEAAEDIGMSLVQEVSAGTAGDFFSFSTPFKPSNWNDAYTTVITGDQQFGASINLSHTTNR